MIGQILSMFGSNIIRFAISLYILETTASSAIYGTVIAISYIPVILISNFGGVLADRADKKRLMVLLDGIYCIITFFMGIIFSFKGSFTLVAILLIILSMVSSLEAPVSQVCIPLIQNEKNLTRANAVSNQISSFASILSPMFSSILYSIVGGRKLYWLMYICAAFFMLSAGIEMLLKIPKQNMKKHATVAVSIKYDLRDIYRLIFKDKRYIGKAMIINGLLTFLVTPYLSIGMTYLIRIKLQLPAIWIGSAQVSTAIATIIGASFATLIADRFQTKNLYKMLIIMGFSFFILIPVLNYNMPSKAAFVIICLTSATILVSANTAGVFIISGMQKACPKNMLGRLMSLFHMFNNMALPIGIWMHGIIYEKYDNNLCVVFLIISVLTVFIALSGKKVYSQLQN